MKGKKILGGKVSMFWVEGNVTHSGVRKSTEVDVQGRQTAGLYDAGEGGWDQSVAAVIKPFMFLLRAMENLFKQETYRIRSVLLKHHPGGEWKGPE